MQFKKKNLYMLS